MPGSTGETRMHASEYAMKMKKGRVSMSMMRIFFSTSMINLYTCRPNEAEGMIEKNEKEWRNEYLEIDDPFIATHAIS